MANSQRVVTWWRRLQRLVPLARWSICIDLNNCTQMPHESICSLHSAVWVWQSFTREQTTWINLHELVCHGCCFCCLLFTRSAQSMCSPGLIQNLSRTKGTFWSTHLVFPSDFRRPEIHLSEIDMYSTAYLVGHSSKKKERNVVFRWDYLRAQTTLMWNNFGQQMI